MKKLLFILGLFISTVSFGQTKEETESWIKEKIQKHFAKEIRTDGGLILYHQLEKISIENGIFQLRYRQTWPAWKDGKYSMPERTYNYFISFPIYAFKNINVDSRIPQMFLNTVDYCEPCKSYRELNGKTESNAGTLRVSPRAEENLKERLEKAFNHLKTFYPAQQKPKEAF